jgi:hypothetical protein
MSLDALIASLSPDEREILSEGLRTGRVTDDELMRMAGMDRGAGTGYPLPGAEIPWQDWLKAKFAKATEKPLARRHIAFWEWLDSIEAGRRKQARVEIWARGGGKSINVEIGIGRLASKLTRRFGLYVCGIQDQADAHVGSCAKWLTAAGANPALTKMNAGKPKAWRRDQLRTANGFNLAAFGIDAGQRGIRIEEYRPDFIVFDDVDERHDSPNEVAKKIECITQSIMPAGASHCIYLFVQNLVHANSIASQLATERADFLLDRELACVEPALTGLDIELIPREGRKPLYKIVAGTPTWAGQSIEICEWQMNEWGYQAFLREAQHEVRAGSSFFPHYDEKRHCVVPPYTPSNPPPRHWQYYGGLDHGFHDPFAFVLKARDENGCRHRIESTQAAGMTNEEQAKRVVAIIRKWGIPLSDCPIGFDQSMRSRDTLNAVQGEAAIEAFYREGLNCVPVMNDMNTQYAGFQGVRDQQLVPGEPSPAFLVWEGYNVDLKFAYSNATYDKLVAEKLNHDECSHLAQADRYSEGSRPDKAVAPARVLTTEENRAQAIADAQATMKALRDAQFASWNGKLGLVPSTDDAGNKIWVAGGETKGRMRGT